jgi:hypothetical protein
MSHGKAEVLIVNSAIPLNREKGGEEYFFMVAFLKKATIDLNLYQLIK